MPASTSGRARPRVEPPPDLLYVDGVLDAFATLTVEDGRVQAAYVVRNPDKLGHLGAPVGLSRR